MPFEAAKCPTCGAGLNIDPNMEYCFCANCGNKISTQKAINECHIQVSGNVSVHGVSTVANDLARGNNCLTVKDWDTAYEVFGMAVDKQTNNLEAWYGLLEAITHKFSEHMLNCVQINGEKGLISVIHNCNKYLPSGPKEEFYKQLNRLLEMWEDTFLRVRSMFIWKKILGWVLSILPYPVILGSVTSFYASKLATWRSMLIIIVISLISTVVGKKVREAARDLEPIYWDYRRALPQVRDIIRSLAK